MAIAYDSQVPKEGARRVSKAKQTDTVKLLRQQQLKEEQEAVDSEQRELRAAKRLEVLKQLCFA